MHVVQSPDGKWTNWRYGAMRATLICVSKLTLAWLFGSSSIARAMIYDKRHLVGLVIEPQHIWQIRELWKKEGKDCKWALCLGVSLKSSSACPRWTDLLPFADRSRLRRSWQPACLFVSVWTTLDQPLLKPRLTPSVRPFHSRRCQ